MSGFISGFSIPFHLVCLSVLIPVPHSFDDSGFVIVFAVWKSYTSYLIFVSQDCFGNSGSFVDPYKFLDCSISVKNVMGNLIEITFQSVDCFE